MDVRRIKIWLLSDCDYPERVVTLDHDRVRDLPDLLARAQQLDPTVRADHVVQTIWRLGSYRLGQNPAARYSCEAVGAALSGSGAPT
jgi:hypothetical protein